MDIATKAFIWGIISAISLPIGALLGVVFRPGKKINSALMAFGAGALLFALTIELFGEAILESEKHGKSIVFAVMGGAILGGLIFDALNQILNSKGAFARSISTAKRYLATLKRINTEIMIERLSKIPILASLPPEAIITLISKLKQETYKAEEEIFQQGNIGNALYFIIKGKVNIIVEDNPQSTNTIATLKQNDIFGEIALITDIPRTATAKCVEDTEVYRLTRHDFQKLINAFPEVKEKVSNIAKERIDELYEKISPETSDRWSRAVQKRLADLRLQVTDEDIENETSKVIKTGSTAAFAIWLGILIDAIPESMVIGMLTKSVAGISIAFIAGVFLANLPEAMSSSTTMLKGGMKIKKIILMWLSLVILTGIGAYLGAVLFPQTPEGSTLFIVSGIEGLAAGAMLTMIAETMLPEAFEQGGAIVGMSTLLGFLAALSVKILA